MLLTQQLQQQPVPPARPQTSPGQGGSGFKVVQPKKPANWVEIKRASKTERIENPNDPEQFIEVEVASQVTMKNSATGDTETWTFGKGR